MPELTFWTAANFALANFLASRSFGNVSVALGCRRFAHGRSNETYHVPRDLLAMRPSRGLGPQRTIIYFLVAFRSGIRALCWWRLRARSIPIQRKRRRPACAGQRNRGVERAPPSADQPSRCGLICSDAVEGCPDLAHDKTSFDCGTRLCCSSLPGLSAGCQGFRRHDRNREHELRPLAVYARASVRRNHLDLRFLDRTQLRCCSK